MRIKVFIYLIFLVPVIVIGSSYIKFINLEMYSMGSTSIKHNNLTFKPDDDLYNQYVDGEIKFVKSIGKVEKGIGFDDWIFGIKIYKIKGIDEKMLLELRA